MLIKLTKYLNNYALIKKYIKHNYYHFKNNKNAENIFLVEFNGWQAMHIAFSYLANFFLEKKNCNIVPFESYNLFRREKLGVSDELKWNLGKFFKIKNFGVYYSFGAGKFLEVEYNDFVIKRSHHQVKYFYSKRVNLKNLENLRVENIWIGDLIYDSYLKKFSKITVDMDSELFKVFFLECLKNFYFWFDYFNKKSVKGIVVGHSVYISAIPLRIANFNKILNFNFSEMTIVNCSNTISYKKKQNSSDIHFRYFRKIFKKFKKSEIQKYLDQGKSYLNKIIKGEIKYSYMKKTSFSKKIYNLDKSSYKKKIKVAIYSHQFSDSPHVLGNHFFPDFFEWFKFLEIIIKKTDYEWYIKCHPNQDEITKKTIQEFVKRNPNINLLGKSISNFCLVQKKIDFALTVFGTVASELPFFGIKVINASRNNPHYDYNFCINPKNVSEYKAILMNLSANKFKINIKDLYEYHYMKQNYQLQTNNSIFFNSQDYLKYVKEIRRPIYWTNECYRIWLNNFSEQQHKRIKVMIEKFIGSNSYMIMPISK
jgi:hypothetical protein